MFKRGYSEEMTLGDGLWFGWMGDEKFVSGVLATAVLNETGRLRGLLDWEGFFVLLYS